RPVYEQVQQHDDDGYLHRRAHEARHQGDGRVRTQGAHGRDVRHLRAARHGQREGVAARAEDAEDEALGYVAVLEDGQGYGVHEHDEHAGVDAAHAQDYADDQQHRDGDDVFARVARSGL